MKDTSPTFPMPPRFFCPTPLKSAAIVELPAAVAHHAARVLRLKIGDSMVLFNGEGGEYPATMTELGKRVHVQLGLHDPVERELPLEIVLVQGIPAADKMDTIIQKAVELGVHSIIPLASARSIVRLSEERAAKRQLHWQQVAVSASEQCGRNRIAEIAPVQTFSHFFSGMQKIQKEEAIKILLSPHLSGKLSDLPPLSPHTSLIQRIIILVGPEGGFTKEEEHAALCAHFQGIALGPRILRTETAGMLALAVLATHYGMLK